MEQPNFGIDEQAAFEHWLDKTSPSGDSVDVLNQWIDSPEYAHYMERLDDERAKVLLIKELHEVDSYVTEGQSCRYVRLDEIPSSVIGEFDAWILNQTRPLIRDDPSGPGERGHCYVWDWTRWRDDKVRKLTAC